MTNDATYMRRAMELATQGAGSVSPNPLVGCVIVAGDRIIGEGWHQRYGEAHAEVEAVRSVADQSQLKGSTVYVNLEPCSHVGKTPPCADMLIQHQVGRVVIANQDSNPIVSGRGIARLRDAGIEVATGCLEQEGRWLNRRFFCAMENKRPYIILKWAQTADGFIARENGESKWISNNWSRRWVHKWRSEEDAILVGTHTARIDNPALTVRDWAGRNPVRVVIDRFLRLPATLQLFDRTVPTWVINVLTHEEHERLRRVRVNESTLVEDTLKELYSAGLHSLLVEGGTATLRHFIEKKYWDEARVFRSTHAFGKGLEAPVIRGKLLTEEDIMGDRLSIYAPIQN